MSAAMATKKEATPTTNKGGRPRLAGDATRKGILTIKRSQDYQDWIQEFAAHAKRVRYASNMSNLIDNALADAAEKTGFKKEQPPR